MPSKKQETTEPLGIDYARNIAENWPDLPHAKDVLPNLPEGLRVLLSKQSPEFLTGFINGIAVIHDMGVKPMVEEAVARTAGTLSDPRDILLTKVGATVEGCGYLACVELLKQEEEDESGD
jgi:hypothetical protein